MTRPTDMMLFTGFKKYILEFLMLFLAVFLGFLADNLRESFIEKSKEEKYVRSLIEDIRTDQKILQAVIASNKKKKAYIDSLTQLCFRHTTQGEQTDAMYQYFPIVLEHPEFFIPNELTMLQLKNAGGLRLIHKQEAVEAIFNYELKKKLLEDQSDYYQNYQTSTINLGLKIFDLSQMRNMMASVSQNMQPPQTMSLITEDKGQLTEFANLTGMYSGIIKYYIILLELSHQEAEALISQLQAAYQLQ